MKRAVLPSLLIAAVMISSAEAITITGFGSGDLTVTYSDFSAGSPPQTATTLAITGTDFGDQIYGDLATPVNITGSDSYLTLTGTYSGSAISSFWLEVYDVGGNFRRYEGDFEDFTPNVETSINLPFLSQTGPFNSTVVGIGLITQGPGNPVALTMNTLSSVPEPGTAALVAISLLGLGVARRRR